jgi:CBS domain-containing protein
MTETILAVVVVIALVAGLALLRARTGNKLDIKSSDIVFALVPVALWMLLTGKITELTVGDVKIVTAIREASASPVKNQVTPLPVADVRMDPKEGVGEIPALLRRKTEALSFRLGHGGYYGPAIAEYLVRLSQSPSFRYVVITEADGKFLGMIDSRQISALLSGPGGQGADEFAAYLNRNDAQAILRMPGIVPREKAITKTTDKRQALMHMESLDVQTLPVVDEGGRFVGIVDRSKLTASILIEISQKVGT